MFIPLILPPSFSFPQKCMRLILRQEIILLQELLLSSMNILDFEEMTKVQQKLLSLSTCQEYQLQALDQTLIGHLSNFSSSLFAPAEAELLQQVHKSIKNAQNVVKLKNNQSSAMLKVFTYVVVSIVFPPSKCSRNKQRKGNQLLLETIKCSLFSKDIRFPQLSKFHFSIDNIQAKSMIARFFNLLASSTLSCDLEIIKYAEWLLENHAILLQLFTVFFRIILDKLNIEDALDQTKELVFSPTITNLIEFFDINYRNQGNLILFPDDNYFLASVDGQMVFGQYLPNGMKEDHEPKQQELEKKTSNHQKITHKDSVRKNGVIEGDIKMFNFMLESGRSSIFEKDDSSLTPHFENNNEFAFGKKKKEDDQIAKHQHFQREFQKILLNSDSASIRENDMHVLSQINDAQPNLVKPTVETKRSRKSKEKPDNHSDNGQEKIFLLRKDTFGKQDIMEIDAQSYDNQMINPQQSRNSKNIVSVKDKHLATFSPPAPKAAAFEHFSSSVNDKNFLEPDSNIDYLKFSNEKIDNLDTHRFGSCFCVQLKMKKNNLVSKIIDFMFVSFRTRNSGCRSPKFINTLKHSQNIMQKLPQIRITPPKPTKNIIEPAFSTIKQNRTPNFIKGLKKDKEKVDKNSVSSKSKQKQLVKDKSLSPNHPKNMTNLDLDKQQSGKFSKFAKFSAIITKDIQSKPKQSKSTTRKNDTSSLPKSLVTEQGGTIKRFDSQFVNVRPGLCKNNWKSISKLPPQQIEKIQNKRPTQKDENIKKDHAAKTRIFAQQNIIAPTMQLNFRNQHCNKAIIHSNDGYDEMSKDRVTCRMEAKSLQIRLAQFRKKT